MSVCTCKACAFKHLETNQGVLQIQSSQIQTEERFGYMWIHHAVNSSHLQTNVVVSQQHGIVDDTQLVAVILSHQFA